jgi:uncharacterized protein (DUF1778 family)
MVKTPKRGRPAKAVTREDVLQIRLEPLEKKAFTDAASLAGLDVSSWVRERLRRAAVLELEAAAMPIAFLQRGI